ncbi:hypothetical protein [Flavobacterium sp.]|uniref:hypothetical protein n=1 Tax=Flavobacterium sp. TaxID=239 RepID=UPI003752CD1A
MYRNFIKISFVIILQILLVGCKNTLQKSHEFVNSYNLSAPMLTNQIITSTTAKVLPENIIEIRFETSLEQNEENKNSYTTIFPSMITNLFTKDETIKDLIDEGISFKVGFYASNNSKFSELTVDKTKIAEFEKSMISESKTVSADYNSKVSPELNQMLVVMNKSLPIVNKDGTKILKIKISDNNELIYIVEIPEEYVQILKTENAKNMMKDEIKRGTDFKKIMSSVQSLNINKIKYIYQDTKGLKVNEINLNQNDLN